MASLQLSQKPPITDSNPSTNILIYKQGVQDAQDYSSLPS